MFNYILCSSSIKVGGGALWTKKFHMKHLVEVERLAHAKLESSIVALRYLHVT